MILSCGSGRLEGWTLSSNSCREENQQQEPKAQHNRHTNSTQGSSCCGDPTNQHEAPNLSTTSASHLCNHCQKKTQSFVCKEIEGKKRAVREVQTSEQKPGDLQKIRVHHGGQKEKRQDSRDSLLLSRPSLQFSVYASSTVRDKVAAIKQRDNNNSAPICPLLGPLWQHGESACRAH